MPRRVAGGPGLPSVEGFGRVESAQTGGWLGFPFRMRSVLRSRIPPARSCSACQHAQWESRPRICPQLLRFSSILIQPPRAPLRRARVRRALDGQLSLRRSPLRPFIGPPSAAFSHLFLARLPSPNTAPASTCQLGGASPSPRRDFQQAVHACDPSFLMDRCQTSIVLPTR